MPEQENSNLYRILSLDGGGSWALIQIRALQQLYGENTNGYDVLKHFDLVVANSGGSIAAMAMAEGWPLSKIIDLYLTESKRREIFVKLTFWEKSIVGRIIKTITGIGPKYNAEKKLSGFEKILPDIGTTLLENLPGRIGKCSPHFLITTFDYDRERATFFRSNANSKAQTHQIAAMLGIPTKNTFDQVTVAQAIHAASNAPLNFFDKPAQFKFHNQKRERRFWDGAVGGYNNPVVAGIVEALCNDINPANIRVLSIGTANTFLPLKDSAPEGMSSAYDGLCKEPEKSSLANDIAKMATSILDDPPDAASFIAYSLLDPTLRRQPPCLVRMNPLIQPILHQGKWELPAELNLAQFKRLVDLDLDAVEQEDVELIDYFCSLWLKDKIPNQPIRIDGEMQCILGHPHFSDAYKDCAFIYFSKITELGVS